MSSEQPHNETNISPSQVNNIGMMPTMLFDDSVSSNNLPPLAPTEVLISQNVQSIDQNRTGVPQKNSGNSSTVVPESLRNSNIQNGSSSHTDSAQFSKQRKSADNPDRIAPGTIIDEKYRIVNVLGMGGFSIVYRAIQLKLEREVAIKVMNRSDNNSESAIQRFYREAKIASGIGHPNIAEVFDYGTLPDSSQPYMAMELLRGHDLLAEMSKNGPMAPARAFKLLRPVLDALNVGHKKGIIHKDLKPENLFLVDPGTPGEFVKVLDFGVARINSNDGSKSSRLTMAGQIMGTPRFLAPEYILTQHVFPATDVYQMALIFAELISGKQAVSNDITLAISAHTSGKLILPDFLKNGPVGEVFKRALSISYLDRYPNAGAFGVALDSVKDAFEKCDSGVKSTISGMLSENEIHISRKFNMTMTIVLSVAIFVIILFLAIFLIAR